MPKKRLWVPLLFVVGGLAITLAAIFAEKLGIDPSAGWGRGRIALFLFGILITAVALLAWYEPNRTRSVQHRIQSFLDKVPGISGILRVLQGVRLPDALRNYWAAIPLSVFVMLVYVWLISSGTWTTWTSPTRYYADLARGFLQGHLYLAVKVSPELLASPDPYEPLPSGGTQGPIDYSYYNGRYYLPWGPAPAVIVLAFRELFHWWLGDLQLTFGFTCGLLLVQFLLAISIRERYFRNLPKWLLWMPLLLIAFAGPVPFMLNNHLAARIYEASVAGAQFFLMCGLLMALVALERSSLEWTLGLAGAFWALAAGTRLNLALPIGVMVLMVAGWILRAKAGPFRTIKALALLCIPLAVGGALVGWYNWARFGSVLETGYFYQLAGINLHEHWYEGLSSAYVLPNLYAYLINPIHLKSAFPFVNASPANALGLYPFQPAFPGFYFSQIITGLAWLAPFVLFAIIPVAQLLFNRRRAGPSPDQESPRFLNWIQLTLSSSSLITFIFLLLFFWSAMRYIEDFLPSLILLSVLGFWQGYVSLSQKMAWRRLYTALGMFLTATSISISTLVAISVNDARFGLISLLGAFSH